LFTIVVHLAPNLRGIECNSDQEPKGNSLRGGTTMMLEVKTQTITLQEHKTQINTQDFE
jgi:hypothetical protein